MKNFLRSLRISTVIAHALWLLICGLLIAVILEFNDGQFIYTLDDPYIHLAVAEEIARGGYGVNSGEFSSPASSALWPLLLVPFAGLPWGDLVPMLLNVTWGSLTIAIVLRRIDLSLPGATERRLGVEVARVVMTLAILVLGNAVGLAFTGMEHGFQLLFAVAVVDGMLTVAESRKLQWWHVVALVFGPMVRFENLAFSAVGCLFLLARRRWKLAMTLGVGALLGLAAFCLVLLSLDLGPVPNSVMAKAGVDSTYHGEVGRVLLGLAASVQGARGLVIAMLMLGLIGVTWTERGFSGSRAVFPCLAAAGMLHLMAGHYGSFHRYEPYMIGALSFAVLIGAGGLFGREPAQALRRLSLMSALAAVAAGLPYLKVVADIPVASNNIYQQQYQMHRFLSEQWKRPVAVNDLGWTSYRNDQYVLDLWGLASREALDARLEGSDPEWLGTIVGEHDIELVIIYEDWFTVQPKEWVKVAQLDLGRRRVTPSSSKVSFFVTSPDVAPEVIDLCRKFRKTLPMGPVLHVRGDPKQTVPGFLGALSTEMFPEDD